MKSTFHHRNARCCSTAFSTLLFVVVHLVAADQTITGNLIVTGTTEVDGNSFTFGTQGTSAGLSLTYANADADTLTFFLNRNPGSWLWAHSAAIAAMRLNGNHELVLYKADGTTAGLTLSPASNTISLGSTTVYRDATSGALRTNGALTADGAFNAQSITSASRMDSHGILSATSGTGDNFAVGMSGIAAGTPGLWAGMSNNTAWIRSETSGQTWLPLKLGGDSIQLYTGATERMRVAANGNVGIGTDAPQSKFVVMGDVGIGGPYAYYGHKLAVWGNTVTTDLFLNPQTGYDETRLFNSSDGSAASTSFGVNNSAGTPLLSIQYNGNASFGETTSSVRLSVAGSIALKDSPGQSATYLSVDPGTSGAMLRFKNAAGLEKVTFLYNGNVGVSNTQPLTSFSVIGNMSSYSAGPTTSNAPIGGSLFLGDSNFNNTSSFDSAPGLSAVYDSSQTVAAALGFFTFTGAAHSRTERVRILPNGNVGIGTTSPAARLVVAREADGGWTNTQLRLAGTTDPRMQLNLGYNTVDNPGYGLIQAGQDGVAFTNLAINPYGGNVGIGTGTTAPSAKLHVAGTARFDYAVRIAPQGDLSMGSFTSEP